MLPPCGRQPNRGEIDRSVWLYQSIRVFRTRSVLWGWFFSPPQNQTMPKHVVAAAADIPPGHRKLVDVNGRAVVVFNLGGEFFALNNRCPHKGGSLCDGKQTGLVQSSEPGEYRYSRRGEIIRCPWHSWEFDIRTGQSWCD